MKALQGYKASLSSLLMFWYIIFFTGLIFHFRAVSSISTGLLLFTGVLYNKSLTGSFMNKKFWNPVLISCLIYFLYVSVVVLLKDDAITAQRHIELKSALVLVPIVLSCCSFLNAEKIKKLILYYVLLLAAACLYCFTLSFIRYMNSGETSLLFYHELVSPLIQHAVYFSLLLFFAQAYLLDAAGKGQWVFHKTIHLSLIILFSLFLLMLSSKLVIIIFLFSLLYFLASGKKKLLRNKKQLCFVAAMFFVLLVIVFITRNPVSSRFREIFNGNIGKLQKEKYSPADYFNGLEFRLLQWRLVPGILNENKSWFDPLGERMGQQKLREEYISKKMYQGLPGTTDIGYLAYNTHNQFLQSLLTGGMAGALFFLLICFSLVNKAWKEKSFLLGVPIIAVLLFSMTEACFETQYGILTFIFFPLFFSKATSQTTPQ